MKKVLYAKTDEITVNKQCDIVWNNMMQHCVRFGYKRHGTFLLGKTPSHFCNALKHQTK